MYKIQVKTIW